MSKRSCVHLLLVGLVTPLTETLSRACMPVEPSETFCSPAAEPARNDIAGTFGMKATEMPEGVVADALGNWGKMDVAGHGGGGF